MILLHFGHPADLYPDRVFKTASLLRCAAICDAATRKVSAAVLNKWGREEKVQSVFNSGRRCYSDYALTRFLACPLSNGPPDHMPTNYPVQSSKAERKIRVVR